jgi:hypothetical protein
MPNPSLLIVPARFKTGRLYSQIPSNTDNRGDFNVTRATTATRVNANGNIESVASGIPRLDYFASGGTVGCPALLVEPSGSNSILQSTNSASGWTLNNSMTRSTIDVIGVSGVNLTVGVSGSIGSAGSRYTSPILSPALALASGSTYTISFFLKKTTAHTIAGYYVSIAGAAAGDIGGGFNVSGSFSSGSIYNSAGITNRIRRVEQWGTDVYRCSETFTMTASGTVDRMNVGPLSAVNSTTVAPTGTTIGFAAPQLELGSVPTSFIPTTTASVTRNADVISVSGAVSGSIGQTEGTIYAEVDYRNFSTSSQAAILHLFQDGNNMIGIQMVRSGSDNLLQAYAFVLGSLVMSITYTIPSAGIYKIALGYKLDDYKLYVNGVDRGQDTSAGVPTMNQILLGHYTSSIQFNDRIRAAALYTTRLTNDQLAALTAP